MSLLQDDNEYRCAVALNNMGVSLLEQGAYLEAFTTLTDSLGALDIAGGSSARCDGSRRAPLCETLQRASQTLALHSNKSCSKSQDLVSLLPSQSIHKISYDPSLTCMETVLEQQQQPQQPQEQLLAQASFCIRMETSNGASGGSEHDRSLGCAIVLHNIGVAYSCMAKLFPCSEQMAAKQLKSALRFFLFSDSILSECIQECQQSSFHLMEVLVLAIALGHEIVRVLTDLERTSELNMYTDKLRQLRQAAHQMYQPEMQKDGVRLAPAA